MHMLQILPAEEIWEILQYYHCDACLRQLRDHLPIERKACYDALSTVTLITQVERHNPHRRNDEEE